MSNYKILKEIPQNMPLYAHRIGELMEAHNCSNKTLAYKVKVSEGQIWNILNKSNYHPSVDTVQKIADFFKVSVDYLLGKTNAKTLDIDKIKISACTGLSLDEIKFLNKIHSQENDKIQSSINKNQKIAIHEILKNERLLELIGNYMTAQLELQDNGISYDQDKIFLRDKLTKETQIIGTEHLHFIFLQAIEKELEKTRENMLEKINKQI